VRGEEEEARADLHSSKEDFEICRRLKESGEGQISRENREEQT
jgi:hypothetical protein